MKKKLSNVLNNSFDIFKKVNFIFEFSLFYSVWLPGTQLINIPALSGYSYVFVIGFGQ